MALCSKIIHRLKHRNYLLYSHCTLIFKKTREFWFQETWIKQHLTSYCNILCFLFVFGFWVCIFFSFIYTRRRRHKRQKNMCLGRHASKPTKATRRNFIHIYRQSNKLLLFIHTMISSYFHIFHFCLVLFCVFFFLFCGGGVHSFVHSQFVRTRCLSQIAIYWLYTLHFLSGQMHVYWLRERVYIDLW